MKKGQSTIAMVIIMLLIGLAIFAFLFLHFGSQSKVAVNNLTNVAKGII